MPEMQCVLHGEEPICFLKGKHAFEQLIELMQALLLQHFLYFFDEDHFQNKPNLIKLPLLRVYSPQHTQNLPFLATLQASRHRQLHRSFHIQDHSIKHKLSFLIENEHEQSRHHHSFYKLYSVLYHSFHVAMKGHEQQHCHFPVLAHIQYIFLPTLPENPHQLSVSQRTPSQERQDVLFWKVRFRLD